MFKLDLTLFQLTPVLSRENSMDNRQQQRENKRSFKNIVERIGRIYLPLLQIIFTSMYAIAAGILYYD